jgi:hypothetical protein
MVVPVKELTVSPEVVGAIYEDVLKVTVNEPSTAEFGAAGPLPMLRNPDRSAVRFSVTIAACTTLLDSAHTAHVTRAAKRGACLTFSTSRNLMSVSLRAM